METRFLIRDSDGEAYGVSYRWRDDGSDADLVREAQTAAGAWSFPGADDCLRCHNAAAGFVLGLNTRQLNRSRAGAPRGSANQLRAWSDSRRIDRRLDEAAIARAPRLVGLFDQAASPRDRARSYLDVNCGCCHRPRGVNALFDARYYTPLEHQGLIDGEVLNTLGMDDARVVAPGDPGRSLLFLRMYAVGPSAMPPVGKNRIDQAALDLISQWIQRP